MGRLAQSSFPFVSEAAPPLGAGPAFPRFACGCPVLLALCARLLADIAAAGDRRQSKLLATTSHPASLNFQLHVVVGSNSAGLVQGRSAEIPWAGSGQALRRQAIASRRPALPQDDIEK